MEREEKYILMHQDDEVLSFSVTFKEHSNVTLLEKLSRFDKAPYGMEEDKSKEELNQLLNGFLVRRCIPETRWDYQKILVYTGARNGFELSFKGHGLSLSNHYWFQKPGEKLRYKDINFFENTFDDRFGKAVLSGDYEALRDVSFDVPDIVTPGWGVKGWLCEEDGPRLYKLGIAKDHYEEPLAEVLSSSLGRKLLGQEDVLDYELRKIYGKYTSSCKPVVGLNEELIPLSRVLPSDLRVLYKQKESNHYLSKEFYEKLSEIPIPKLSERFTKLACFRSLCFANDLHFDNLFVIQNENIGQLRVAPLMDFGCSFGCSETARSLLSNPNKATYLIIYFMFADLDPDWDYSWYQKDCLDGFEEEIRDILGKSEFYSPSLLDSIIDVYHHQKVYLDSLASKKE